MPSVPRFPNPPGMRIPLDDQNQMSGLERCRSGLTPHQQPLSTHHGTEPELILASRPPDLRILPTTEAVSDFSERIRRTE
jgi:hypothetical protein